MKKYLYFSLLLTLTGCARENNSFHDHFHLEDSFELNYDMLTDINYYSYRFGPDSILTFRQENKLRGIDLNNGAEILNIQLPKQKGYYYRDHLFINQDSIFVCSISNDTMYVIHMNNTGAKHKVWDITSKAQEIPGLPFTIDADHSHPMLLIDNQLFFQASYTQNPKIKLNTQIPVEAVLDLKTGQIQQYGSLPSSYGQGDFYGNHQYESSRIVNDNDEMIFSFPSCHNLYVYNMEGRLLRTIECKSRFIEQFEPINADYPAIIDAYGYNARYSDLIYDEYRNQYYRVVLHKLNKYDENNLKNDIRKRMCSVMVLDKEFNIMKELMMPVGMFWKRLIVTKQGLMLKPITDNQSNTFQIYKPCTD